MSRVESAPSNMYSICKGRSLLFVRRGPKSLDAGKQRKPSFFYQLGCRMQECHGASNN